MTEILAFNRWSTEGIKVEDPGLTNYINLSPRVVPRTGGKYAGNRFHKSRVFIVERLVNRIMVSGHKAKKHKASSGHNTGKANAAMNIVIKAFEIVEKKTGENPIKVLAKAIENGAPREEIITIEYGGARYPKPVETAPQRRVDIVLKLITQGAYQKCFNKKKTAESALADEIINAYTLNQTSAIIQKKLELERQADASR
jgi:small subunit ribosomal protein S7